MHDVCALTCMHSSVAKLQRVGAGVLFFLTQGRMSCAPFFSSWTHKYTSAGASIVDAVCYTVFDLRQMRLRQGSVRKQPKAQANHHASPMVHG